VTTTCNVLESHLTRSRGGQRTDADITELLTGHNHWLIHETSVVNCLSAMSLSYLTDMRTPYTSLFWQSCRLPWRYQ